jgi:type VI secretion system protein ImpA
VFSSGHVSSHEFRPKAHNWAAPRPKHPAMDDSSLLAPVSAEEPCGPDLEYDPAFLALETSLEGAFMDRAVGPEGDAPTIEWKQIADQALAILDRSKDLRVAVTLTKAWLNMKGVEGLHRGLTMMQQLLSLRWGSVHPQIGAQGDTEGIMRMNALRGLCDTRTIISSLRGAPLVRARGMRALCLRELEAAQNPDRDKQSDSNTPDAAVVDATFIGCDLDELEQTHKLVLESRAATAALEQLFEEHNTPAGLSLHELLAQLDAINGQLGPRVRARRAALAVAQAESESDDAELELESHENGSEHSGNGAATVSTSSALATRRRGNNVASRAEVLSALDGICAYFDAHEPTSPVPMLLRRAKRLATMSFVDLVRELAPSGVNEVETLRGPETADNP